MKNGIPRLTLKTARERHTLRKALTAGVEEGGGHA